MILIHEISERYGWRWSSTMSLFNQDKRYDITRDLNNPSDLAGTNLYLVKSKCLFLASILMRSSNVTSVPIVNFSSWCCERWIMMWNCPSFSNGGGVSVPDVHIDLIGSLFSEPIGVVHHHSFSSLSTLGDLNYKELFISKVVKVRVFLWIEIQSIDSGGVDRFQWHSLRLKK